MRKCILISLFLVITIIYCKGKHSNQQISSYILSESVVTHELVFGAEDLPDEYLLAVPISFVVDNDGNIYVADEEYKIKIYDSKGNGRKIIGGRGEGPGEFFIIAQMNIDNKDTLFVSDRQISRFNIFHRDTFIKTESLLNKPSKDYKTEKQKDRINHIQGFSISLLNRITGSQRIYKTGGDTLISGNDFALNVGLLYEYNDTLNELVTYSPSNLENLTQFGSVGSVDRSSIGYLYHYPLHSPFLTVLLPENRIAYSHIFIDDIQNNNTFRYTIHIKDLNTMELSHITHNYKPIETKEAYDKGAFIKVMGDVEEYTKKHIYHPALCALHYDDECLFAVREANFGRATDLNIDIPYQTDVFDAQTGTYIRTVEFPFKPQYIKNGYIYRKIKNQDGYWMIEKYRIDPRVYGK